MEILETSRSNELVNLTIENIQYHGDVILVKFPYTKTHKERSYTLEGEHAAIFKKYADLRPTKLPTNRFFLSFQNGKCTVQVIGKDKMAKCNYKIATYLGLPDSTRFLQVIFYLETLHFLFNFILQYTSVKKFKVLTY